jgi:hypothetical protein
MRTRVVAVTVGIVASVTGGCAVPVPTARSASDYGKKAADTADTVRSAVNTAVVALEAAGEGRVPSTTLDVLLSEAEDDASGADETFRAIQPKGRSSDEVRRRLVDLDAEALDTLEESRIAARRGDAERYDSLRSTLNAAAAELDAFVEDVG